MELDNVLKKLRKLQKLYEGAKKINSEGEAANAAAAIQRLLTEYNLTMAEVGHEEEKKNETNEDVVSGFNFKSIGGQWEYRLWYVICKWNFCKCFQYGGSYKRLIIFGAPENLITVKWMFGVLSERFVEFSKQKFKEYKNSIDYAVAYHKPTKDRYQRDYLMGAVQGLDAKLKEISDQDKKNEPEYGAKVTALVVRNNTAIDEYINNKFGKVRTVGHGGVQRGVHGARAAGYKDGYNTDLHKPIRSNQHKAVNNVKLLS